MSLESLCALLQLWQFKWVREGLIYYCLLNYTHSSLLLQVLDNNESAFGVKCELLGMAF